MGSLTKCSARMGKLIAPEELDEIRARTRSYTEEGMAPAEAATEAVNDQLEEAYEALDTVIKAILEQHGVDLVPAVQDAAPYSRFDDMTEIEITVPRVYFDLEFASRQNLDAHGEAVEIARTANSVTVRASVAAIANMQSMAESDTTRNLDDRLSGVSQRALKSGKATIEAVKKRIAEYDAERGAGQARARRRADTVANYEARIDELFAGAPASRDLANTRVAESFDLTTLISGGKIREVFLKESKVLAGIDNHPEITAEIWKKVPQWIENPAAVFMTDTGKNGELVFVAPELVGGNVVSIIVEPESQVGRASASLLVNAYSRGVDPLVMWARRGLAVYVDEKKSRALGTSGGRQLPAEVHQWRGDNKSLAKQRPLFKPADLYKYRADNGLNRDGTEPAPMARRKVQIPTQFTDYTIPTDDFRKAYANAHGRAIEKYIAAAKASGSWMRRKFVDDMYPVKLVEEAVEQGGNYDSESMNVYQRAELYYGKVGYHLESFRNEFVKPLAHELARADKKGISIDDLELYLYAKFAPVRNRKIYDLRQQMNPNTSNEWLDGGSGMSNQAAKDIIDEFTQKGQIAELEKLAQMVYALNDYRTTVAERAGLISAEVAADWRSEPTYIPLKGFADGREIAFERAPSPGKGFSVSGKEARAAKGRKSRADQLIENAIAQAELTIIRAHKNAVAQSLLSMVKSNQNENLWEIQRTGFAPRRDPSTGEFVLDSDGEKILDPLSVNRGDPATFAVKVAGKEVLIKFKGEGGERLATAMKNLGANNLGTFMQVMRGVSRWLSMTLTTLNPEFTITNFARDIQTALVNAGLENGGDVAKEMMRGIRPSLAAIFRASKAENGFGGTGKWDVLYREFQADGGKTNFGVVRDLDEIYKDIKSEISAGTENGVIKGVRRTWDYFMAANEAVENATRLAIYAASRKSGASRKDAASIAKNITVNFNRRGEFGPALNSLYLFYNASVQGTARFAQFVAKNPKKVAMYWAGPTFALGVATAFLNTFLGGADADGEDRWAKVPDHVKDRNLVLMMGDDYIKIPLPYVYNLPYVMGNKAADVMLGHTKVSTATAAIARNLWTNFNPMGDNYLLPTMVGPVLDIESNTNFFGSPIRPENSFEQYKVPDSDKYWEERTPSLYVALAKGLNAATGGSDFKPGAIDISPTTFQYWTEFWTGGIGTFTGRIWSTLQAPFDSEPGLTPPVNRVPFVNKVVGAQSEKQASVDYYARREDVNARAAELELIIDSGAMGEIPADERVTYGVTSQLSASLKAAEAQLRQLRRQHRAARDAGNDEVVRELETRMLQVQQEFNTQYVRLVRDIEGQPLR